MPIYDWPSVEVPRAVYSPMISRLELFTYNSELERRVGWCGGGLRRSGWCNFHDEGNVSTRSKTPRLTASQQACAWSRLLVSSALAACRLVLYGFGLVSAGFAVLCGFMYSSYFVLVSAALAAFCLVLFGFGLVSARFAVLCGFVYFVLVSAALTSFCLASYGF